jgi:hypothetical protein
LRTLIGLAGQWHRPEAHPVPPPPLEAPAQNPGSVGTLVWSLPIVGFILGAVVVSGIVAVIGDVLPTPVLLLFAIFGAGFAIWAAVSTSSDPPKAPLPVMIFLAVSGISMLAFGIACYFRNLRLGTYIGCCAAVVATVFLIIWETGSSGGWISTPTFHQIPAGRTGIHGWHSLSNSRCRFRLLRKKSHLTR